MTGEPDLKRAMVFVDGQNLFHAAKEAFGYREPNFDVRRLAELVCAANQWELCGVRFYTGLPDDQANPRWHGALVHESTDGGSWAPAPSFTDRSRLTLASRVQSCN